MSDLTQKRVHWYEENDGTITHDEDVDVLTSAACVTCADGETLQAKLNLGEFATSSELGDITGLDTENTSSAVDAINEVVSDIASTNSSLTTLAGKVGSVGATDLQTQITNHTGSTSNPHGVTKAQVGLGNVPNVSTNDQTPTYVEETIGISSLTSGEKLSVAFSKIAGAISGFMAHLLDTSNPHGVTKAQVGLGNCDNTSDANKPISTATQTALSTHTGDTSNPHSVTKAQVGLGNCNNTSDVDKPISTATQAAIDYVADGVAVNLIKNDATDRISSGITYTNQSDGSILAQGTATATSIQFTSATTKLKGGVTYCLKGVEGNYHVQLTNVGSSTIYVDSNGGASKLYTPSQDVEAIWRIRITNGVSINTTIYPMLEVGEVSHKYQPYIGADSIPQALSTRVEWERRSTGTTLAVSANGTTTINKSAFASGFTKIPNYAILMGTGSTTLPIFMGYEPQADNFSITFKSVSASDVFFFPSILFGYVGGK